jgi:hypothetical protein
MRFMCLSDFAVDVIDRALLDVSLYPAEVLTEHRHQKPL